MFKQIKYITKFNLSYRRKQRTRKPQQYLDHIYYCALETPNYAQLFVSL